MNQIQQGVVRGERGQALVEFAVASVVFLMTVFGTLQFGLMVWHYNMISNLAQEGARWASVHGSTSGSPASVDAVRAYVRSRALGLLPSGCTTCVSAVPAPSTLMPGSFVTVTVTMSYTPITGLLPSSTMNMSSSAKMVVAR